LNGSYQRIHDNNRVVESPHQDLLANARIETSTADYFSIKPREFFGKVFRREVPASHIDKSSSDNNNSYKTIEAIIEDKGDQNPGSPVDSATFSRTPSYNQNRQSHFLGTSVNVNGYFLHSNQDNPNQHSKSTKPMKGDRKDTHSDDGHPRMRP
jgi:hypothetical protein